MKDKKVTAEISVSIPILKNLPDDGFSLNIGALTLKFGEKNFILDSANTDFENQQDEGSKFIFSSSLEVDTDTFEEGDEYNYDLTEQDLIEPDLKAEFFCSDSDVGIDDAFDFEAAIIECVLTVDDQIYTIKNISFE